MERDRRRERHRQAAFDTIREYRDRGRPFETHSHLTPSSWAVLSYPIPPTVWFQYYREMERFLVTVGREDRTLYIHGVVFVPFNTPLYDELRVRVYRMFYFNTPHNLWLLIRTIRFRLLFVASTSFGDHVRIERLRVNSEPSNSFYPGGMFCES